ncbi:hypothetical protein Zmor_023850 [Zophobas morio]|uniref:Tyr recombinase domain-containing protein n=1 Tax=Zophobas morio TaxID=2755281 RepID=A0AA38I0M8_9CUCU|nr:hypothetical protein Zmor_023850 [Zophobas morio]
MSNFRFGRNTPKEIDDSITNITPLNTKNSRNSIWRQFEKFCGERKYVFDGNTSTEKLAFILKDWGYNMKKVDGNDYKEAVIKTMWNVTAKQLQELYFNKFGIKFDPFVDLEFKGSRNARDAKRRNLQIQPEKRKTSSSILTLEEYNKILKIYNEDTPDGLQKMFFYVAGLELAWRGCEGVNVTIKHFKEESDNCGLPTGRIEYNCIFSKTAQGGSHKLTDSKWLATNTTDPRICPVRLYKKMLSKRGKHITTDRLFLTPNPAWREPSSVGWFKNSPVGRNEMGKWTRTAAEEIGIDIKKKKISNHSLRSTAVSQLAKAGVGEEQLIKITGHANTFSIKPYLQLDGDHHYQMIDKLRANSTAMEESNNKSTNCAPSALIPLDTSRVSVHHNQVSAVLKSSSTPMCHEDRQSISKPMTTPKKLSIKATFHWHRFQLKEDYDTLLGVKRLTEGGVTSEDSIINILFDLVPDAPHFVLDQ